MNHNLRSYWRGCRCQTCKDANARYWRAYYFGRRTNFYVPATRARQLLLTFENSEDASRVTKVPQPTIYRILKGQVKKIRVQTERKIMRAA